MAKKQAPTIFPKFFTRTIIWLGIIFAAILSVLTLFFTANITDYYESNIIISFAPYIIIGIILFIVLFACPPIRKFLSSLQLKTLLTVVVVWGLAASLAWIFISDVQPMWDSLDLVYAASYLNGDQTEFAIGKWAPGSYMEHFPFQLPLVIFIAILQRIFGSSGSLIVFQILNCLACAVSMYFIVKLTDIYFKKKEATAISAILVMLFSPIIFYCTFIYGNILCLPFALACWYFQRKAMEEDSKFYRYAIISVVCGVIACLIKSTMSFAIIASAVIWAVWAFKRKRLAPGVIAVIALLLMKFSIYPLYTIFDSHFGYHLRENAAPSIAWITMGVGGGKEYEADITGNEDIRQDLRLTGYYDSFVWALKDAEYSPTGLADLSKEYLGKRLSHFASDPGFLVTYFAHKIAVAWTEPTFESILANNWCSDISANGYSMCTREHNPLAKAVFYGPTNQALIFFLDCLQTIIAVGLLAALIIERKTFKLENLVPLVCVLGMAFTYIFWENKSQYIFPAYLFMIPFAGLGISIILQRFSQSRIAAALYFQRKSSPRTLPPAPKKSSAARRAPKQSK